MRLGGETGAALLTTWTSGHRAPRLWTLVVATVALAGFIWLGLNPNQPYAGPYGWETYAFGWIWLASLVGGVVWGLFGRPGRTFAVSFGPRVAAAPPEGAARES